MDICGRIDHSVFNDSELNRSDLNDFSFPAIQTPQARFLDTPNYPAYHRVIGVFSVASRFAVGR
jgi:hypothetical protein